MVHFSSQMERQIFMQFDTSSLGSQQTVCTIVAQGRHNYRSMRLVTRHSSEPSLATRQAVIAGAFAAKDTAITVKCLARQREYTLLPP